VDERGAITSDGAGWGLEWWIGADDRWRLPVREPSVRQTLVDDAPVVQTAMRVPSGDAVHRAYGAVGDGDPVVIEIENASPAPFVAALVVRHARTVAVDDTLVMVDNRPGLITARAPSRWAADIGKATEITVCSGQASDGPFVARRSRSGRLEVAFLYPVPHRTTLRLALPGARDTVPVDLRLLPGPDDVARGWRAQIERGLRVELPDSRLMAMVRAACAAALLGATSRAPTEVDAAAAEDWGFDAEATEAWTRLTARQRRRAARRTPTPPTWADVQAAAVLGGASLLVCLRTFLVHDAGAEITLLAELPDGWHGAPIDVHNAPTRHGPVSFAVRWHGERAALLWDGPGGVELRVPGLDPAWSTTEPRGEALLG
jgi:hypothetical protein